MPVNKCCVTGCCSTASTKQLFRFPVHKGLREIWVCLVENFTAVNLKQRKEVKIYELHFEAKYIRSSRRRYFSCPTLFTPDEMRTGQPHATLIFDDMHSYANNMPGFAEDFTDILGTKLNIRNLNHDHNYFKTDKPLFKIASTSTTSGTSGAAEPGTSGVAEPGTSGAAEPGTSGAAEPGTSGAAELGTSGAVEPGKSQQSSLMNDAKASRKVRLVRSTKTLTPKCRKMYNKCVQLIKSKRRLLDTFEQSIEKATKLSKQLSFEALLERMSPQAKIFLTMQASQCDRFLKRRRFTKEDKLLALSLLKQSPKGYKLLRKIFILPTVRTLNRFTQGISLTPGINRNIFAQLQDIVREWDIKKKQCSIVFDEISLTPHLNFVESQDRIEGFVNFGQTSEQRYCDHALVFMIRGLCSNWRQPIAFYLCEGTTPAITLKSILKDVVEAVGQAGLIPKTLICDQGSTFQTCIKSLQFDSRRDQLRLEGQLDNKVTVSGHKLNIIYDPPHLIKGIRNNLLTKDMIFRGKTATWNDIVQVYKEDCALGDIRMLHKLTDEHVIPGKIKKMRVKNCTQVLSERTSAMLLYTSRYEKYADGTPVSPTMKNTAEAVLFFDRLFDSVNGSRGASSPGKIRGPVKELNGVSKHVRFWEEALDTLKNVSFIDSNNSNRKVPSIRNWITTLQSFIEIWSDLRDLGIRYFYTRNCNQDPLENFFGRIRALNARNINPNSSCFISSFKSLIISSTMGPYSNNFNCEDDAGHMILQNAKLFDHYENQISAEEIPVAGRAPRENAASDLRPASLFQQTRREKSSVHSVSYTAEFVSRKLLKKFNCKHCKKSFLTSEITEIHDWITARERKELKGKNLKYPNTRFVLLFRVLIKTINEYLETSCQNRFLVQNIRSIFLNSIEVDWFGCQQHHQDTLNYFINLVCRLQIHNWCNIINKILRGSFSEKLASDSSNITHMQHLAVRKYRATRVKK